MFYSISVASEKCCSSFMWVCIKIFFGKDFYFRCWNIEACLNTFVNYMCPTTIGASLIAQLVKNPPATKETLVWFLGPGEEPLEEEMATHSSILAWNSPWTEDPGGLQSMESQRVRHDWSDWACTCTRKGEGSTTPCVLQCQWWKPVEGSTC